jgi:hypothetical protein
MLTRSGAQGSGQRRWLASGGAWGLSRRTRCADMGFVGAARRGDPAREGGVAATIWAMEAVSGVEWRQNASGVKGIRCSLA